MMAKYRVRVVEENWGDWLVDAKTAEDAEAQVDAMREKLGPEKFWVGNFHADGDLRVEAEEYDDSNEDA